MSKKEIVFAKACVLGTRDWDTFQAIIRTCLKQRKPEEPKKKAPPAKPLVLAGLLLILQLFSIAPPAAASDTGGRAAIVVAGFGTTVPAALTAITTIMDSVRSAFPDTTVRLTFTSSTIRTVWRERRRQPEAWLAQGVPEEVLEVQNLISTIGDLLEEGHDEIIIQPTHLFYMEQSYDLHQYVRAFESIETIKERWRPFSKIVMGRPALGMPGDRHPYQDDVAAVAATLAEDAALARDRGAILLYMGHGNVSWPTGIYAETQKKMRELYPDVTTYIGVAEGSPALGDFQSHFKQAGTNKVLLKPLMIAAGDHALNDLAGPGEDSWKSQLTRAGYEVEPILRGLGENERFARIFVDHIRDAAREAGIVLN